MTLIEVLVALIILSVGLLGLAALQTSGVKFSQDAYIRSQATTLAYDVIERMRINRDWALNGDYSSTEDYGAADSTNNCSFDSITTANAILCWRVAIRESLPGGSLEVSEPDGTYGNEFTITVSWSDRWRQRGASAATTSSQSWMVEI